MIDFFTDLYSAITPQRKFLEKIRFNTLLRILIRWTANLVLPIYFRCTTKKEKYCLPVCTKTEGRLIVSFTSFPARIGKVWQVVETMFHQTHKPDKIILWLSKEQFPTLDVLPKRLLAQRARGLEIELRDGDLRSHKKYYYTLTEYPNDMLCTIDDDIYYSTHCLADLWQKHLESPNAIVANYTHEKCYDVQGELLPYLQWGNNVMTSRGGGAIVRRMWWCCCCC